MARRNPIVFGVVTLAIAGLLVIVVKGALWFHKARNTSAANACINTIRQLESATQQWALENNKTDLDVVDAAGVLKYIRGGEMPSCHDGGDYSLGKIAMDVPRCSILKHNFDGQSLSIVDEHKNRIPGAVILIGTNRYGTDDTGYAGTDAKYGVRRKGTFATVFKSGYQTNVVELPASGAFIIQLVRIDGSNAPKRD